MNSLVWCQREFRLHDYPALSEMLQGSDLVVFAYFFDKKDCKASASDVWLSLALQNMQNRVKEFGGHFLIIEGDFSTNLQQLIEKYQIQKVAYSVQMGETFEKNQQSALQVCKQHRVALQPYFSEFLIHPEMALNKQNQPYRVFTPFYKNIQQKLILTRPMTLPTHLLGKTKLEHEENAVKLPQVLQDLQSQDWAKKIMPYCAASETKSFTRLTLFLSHKLQNYSELRDYPSENATSDLAACLHFGHISMSRVWFEMTLEAEACPAQQNELMAFKRQLVWKEFAKHLIWWFPKSQYGPMQEKFAAMSWQNTPRLIKIWQTGKTGIPIIDAGMQELWQTGKMHNRVRMLVASFLTKNLNQHWLAGKNWFDATLLDADPANNTMGWQWVAGCGVDAAPYNRLFNPILQSQKFDASGAYIRTWLPELTNLSNKAIHQPWLHPEECQNAGIELGKTYPLPIIDIPESRKAHLQRVNNLYSVV